MSNRKDEGGTPQNPGQIGKDGQHNAMDRQGNRAGQTVPNPGAQKAGQGQGGSGSDPNEEYGMGRNRPGQSGESGGLGSQQADDEGGLGGQGLGNRQGGRQVDDNQDDLGRDVNDRGRSSTNNTR